MARQVGSVGVDLYLFKYRYTYTVDRSIVHKTNADVKSFPIPHPYPKKSNQAQHRMDRPYSFIQVCTHACRRGGVLRRTQSAGGMGVGRDVTPVRRRSQNGNKDPNIHIHTHTRNQTLFYVRGTVIMSIWPQILLGLILVCVNV